jgi:hypothetical protein
LPPEADIHMDVAAHLLGSLSEREQRSFDEHLRGCERCRGEATELRVAADAFDAAREIRDAVPPPELRDRVMAAVAQAAAQDAGGVAPGSAEAAPDERRRNGAPAPRPSLRERILPVPNLALAGVAAALVAVALIVGGAIESGKDGPSGELEVAGTMTAPGGGAGSGEITVREAGIGRLIAFETDELPILPAGEYYELWFVGPGDTPSDPNRISAGTFHPDPEGRSDVEFTAAVDPAKYPVVSVTAEPADGDPERAGPEVLRLDSRH